MVFPKAALTLTQTNIVAAKEQENVCTSQRWQRQARLKTGGFGACVWSLVSR